MLTVQEKINTGKICGYLASNELASGKLVGGELDPRLPKLLYAQTMGLQYLYELDPTNADLDVIGNYLIAICRHYLKAQSIIAGGGGGSIAPVNPNADNIYPFVITSADFSTSDTYNDTRLAGVNIMLFINEYAQQWITSSADTFVYLPAGGFTVTIPGFDTNLYSYTIVVQNLGS